MSQNPYQRWHAVAMNAAKAAGFVLAHHFGNLERIDEKGPGDLVTIADKEAEAVILEILRREAPDHTILAEESGQIGRAHV